MPDPNDPSSQDSLSARLKAARQKQKKSARGMLRDGEDDGGPSGLGVGLRMATELVAAVGVGVGIGLILDNWLGTKPWLMILFLLLGCGAAMVNVMRAAKELERQAKERKRRTDQRDRR